MTRHVRMPGVTPARSLAGVVCLGTVVIEKLKGGYFVSTVEVVTGTAATPEERP